MGSLLEPESALLVEHSLLKDLEASLKTSKLLTPGSEEYAVKIKRWSDASEKEAAAIVLATSTADISTTLLFTQEHNIDFAVCGGGHSTSGSSSSEGGIVIDLSLMRKVTVDPSALTITAQGGCLWVDVDEAAGEHGLATVGGTVNHTGIGGLTLGGGYGWLSGAYGLVIDNLLSVRMVLADGSLVTASSTEDPDLFWAVRGAGQSFGVAVEFTYQAHPQRNPIWAGQLAFTPDKIPAVLAFMNNLIEISKGESGAVIGFAVAPPPIGLPVLIVAVFYNGPEDSAKQYFAPILALEPVLNTTCAMPYSSLNAILLNAAHHGGRKTSKGTTIATPIRTDFFLDLFQRFSTFTTSTCLDANQSIMLFEFFSPHKICSVPNTAMSFANRDYYSNAMMLPKWYDPRNDDVVRQWARDMAGFFKEEKERANTEGEVRPEMMEGVGV
ncbi:MAG: hypothetical protein Q9190_004564, partial [Brigantiaea leucoxantha]